MKRFSPSTCGEMEECPDGEWVLFEEHNPIIVRIADAKREFVEGDDGMIVWFPTPSQGAYTADNLKALARELDERNTSWREHMDRCSPESEKAL